MLYLYVSIKYWQILSVMVIITPAGVVSFIIHPFSSSPIRASPFIGGVHGYPVTMPDYSQPQNAAGILAKSTQNLSPSSGLENTTNTVGRLYDECHNLIQIRENNYGNEDFMMPVHKRCRRKSKRRAGLPTISRRAELSFFKSWALLAVHLFYTAISACVLRIRQTYSHSIGTALGIVPHRAVSLQGRIPKIQHLLAAP